MRIAFVHHKGRLARLPSVERGECPTEFFYGAVELERQMRSISQFEIDVSHGGGVTQWLDGVMPREWMPVKTGLPLLIATQPLLSALNSFDCVVATAGNLAFALAMWAAAGLFRRPLIGIHTGVLDYRHGKWRHWITEKLYSRMHTVLFGDAELEPMRREFSIAADKISVNQFGVDTRFWTPAGSSKGYVLSVGNDGRRDFETLCAAASSINAPVRIITSRMLPSNMPPNVEVIRGSWHAASLSDMELRKLYQKASCVVVPIRETLQPSGQSVTLQAMACGKPVVLTRTAGVWSQVMLKDGVNMIYSHPGDSVDLAEKVNRILSDRHLTQSIGLAARDTVEKEATIGDFAHRMFEICERLGRSDARVSAANLARVP